MTPLASHEISEILDSLDVHTIFRALQRKGTTVLGIHVDDGYVMTMIPGPAAADQKIVRKIVKQINEGLK